LEKNRRVPTIIHNLPLVPAPTSVEVRQQRIAVKPYQAVVWVSVTPIGSAPFDARTPCIPAILDLGFNGCFAIREEQLRRWAGLDPRLLAKFRMTHLRGAPAEERHADLWLHPNVSGSATVSRQHPFRVRLESSFFVLRPSDHPRDDRPRLPLIGIRALVVGGLRLVVDGKRSRLSVRTAARFWFLGYSALRSALVTRAPW
jgi:hypothetical protein